MEKEMLKRPYEEAAIAVLKIAASDVITTSGTLGGEFNDPEGWG